MLKNPSEVLQSALSFNKPLSYPTSIVLWRKSSTLLTPVGPVILFSLSCSACADIRSISYPSSSRD
nr:MAG TPA: hypothetical protein [Bacteriophage sp.]